MATTRTKTRTATRPAVLVDPDLPIYSTLVADLPLPPPVDIPAFEPWGLTPPRVVGTASSEHRIVPVDDTGWTTQDAVALLALIDGEESKTDTALLGLAVEPVPQIAEVAS